MSKITETVKGSEIKLQYEIDKINSKLSDIEEVIQETHRNTDLSHIIKELEDRIDNCCSSKHKEIFISMERQAKDIAADVTALERKLEFYNYNKPTQKQNSGVSAEELKSIASKNDTKIKHLEDLIQSILMKFSYERDNNQDNSAIITTNYKSCMVDRADLKILETKFESQFEQLQEEMQKFINTATANEKELDARLRILEYSGLCSSGVYTSNLHKDMKPTKQRKSLGASAGRKASVQTSFDQSHRKTRNDSPNKVKATNTSKFVQKDLKLNTNKTSLINLKYSHEDYEMSESKCTEEDPDVLQDNLSAGAINLINELNTYKESNYNNEICSDDNNDESKLNESDILKISDKNIDLVSNIHIEKAYDPYKASQNIKKSRKTYDIRGNSCKHSMIINNTFGKKSNSKKRKTDNSNLDGKNLSSSSRNSANRQRKSSNKTIKRNPLSTTQLKRNDRPKSKNKGKENVNKCNVEQSAKLKPENNADSMVKQNSTIIKTDKNSKKLKKLEKMYQELSLIEISDMHV